MRPPSLLGCGWRRRLLLLAAWACRDDAAAAVKAPRHEALPANATHSHAGAGGTPANSSGLKAAGRRPAPAAAPAHPAATTATAANATAAAANATAANATAGGARLAGANASALSANVSALRRSSGAVSSGGPARSEPSLLHRGGGRMASQLLELSEAPGATEVVAKVALDPTGGGPGGPGGPAAPAAEGRRDARESGKPENGRHHRADAEGGEHRSRGKGRQFLGLPKLFWALVANVVAMAIFVLSIPLILQVARRRRTAPPPPT